MATIKDVAAKAGVSISTVSFVLNGRAKEMKVSEETSKKVFDAAAALQYKPNATARKLRNAQEDKPMILLYWPMDYRIHYLTAILNGIRLKIEELHFDCDLVIRTYKNDELYRDKDLPQPFHYSAAIIGAPSPADMEYVESLDTALPVILFNRESARHHYVEADEEDAIKNIIQLIAAKGHREIALFRVDQIHMNAGRRLDTVLENCARAGIQISDIYCVEDNYDGGIIAARKYLHTANRPKFILAMTDAIAAGAAYLFNREGVTYPDDLELAAFGIGNPELTKFATPSITVIEMPSQELAKQALDIAWRLVKKEHLQEKKIKHMIPSVLLPRETCQE